MREFREIAFGYLGLDYRDFVAQDLRFYRPVEVDVLISDPSKARRALGWQQKIDLRHLVGIMVAPDLKRLTAKTSSY